MLKYNLCAIFDIMYYKSYISVFYKCYRKSLFTENLIKINYFIWLYKMAYNFNSVFIFGAFVFLFEA